MESNQEGYSLVELVVVMLVFSIVMSIICVSFNRIVISSSQIVKTGETDIGGLIGLELFRSDLELAGFGLPWSLPKAVTYHESGSRVMVAGHPGTDLASFNDENDLGPLPPRAVISGDNVGLNGSDYLVLKGTAMGMSATARSWSYLNYSTMSAPKQSKSELELVPGNTDRVVVIKSTVTASGIPDRQLVTDGVNSAVFTLIFNLPFSQNFLPKNSNDHYMVYGVAPDKRDENGNLQPLSYPYNRADYFIGKPGRVSPTCAGNTGTLYKVTINQNTDIPTYYPLLDCVADMQVIYYLDSSGSGGVDRHVANFCDFRESCTLSAAELRAQLKEIRVYILAQEGKKDRSYNYPLDRMPIVVGDAGLDRAVGKTLGSVWTTAAMSSMDPEWRHYHWKVYTIVVQPKNL